MIIKFDQFLCLVFVGSTDDVCVTEMVRGLVSLIAQ